MLRSPWERVAALAVLAGAVCLPFAGRPLSPDEGGLLILGGQWSDGSSLYGDYFVDRPPLLIALFSLADALGGTPWALRLLGVVAVVTTVLVAGAVGRAPGPSAPVLTGPDRGDARRDPALRRHRRQRRAARAAVPPRRHAPPRWCAARSERACARVGAARRRPRGLRGAGQAEPAGRLRARGRAAGDASPVGRARRGRRRRRRRDRRPGGRAGVLAGHRARRALGGRRGLPSAGRRGHRDVGDRVRRRDASRRPALPCLPPGPRCSRWRWPAGCPPRRCGARPALAGPRRAGLGGCWWCWPAAATGCTT